MIPTLAQIAAHAETNPALDYAGLLHGLWVVEGIGRVPFILALGTDSGIVHEIGRAYWTSLEVIAGEHPGSWRPLLPDLAPVPEETA